MLFGLGSVALLVGFFWAAGYIEKAVDRRSERRKERTARAAERRGARFLRTRSTARGEAERAFRGTREAAGREDMSGLLIIAFFLIAVGLLIGAGCVLYGRWKERKEAAGENGEAGGKGADGAEDGGPQIVGEAEYEAAAQRWSEVQAADRAEAARIQRPPAGENPGAPGGGDEDAPAAWEGAVAEIKRGRQERTRRILGEDGDPENGETGADGPLEGDNR